MSVATRAGGSTRPRLGQVVATINVGQGASFLAVGPDAVRVIAAAADAVWVVVTDDALAEKIMPSAWTTCAGRETIDA